MWLPPLVGRLSDRVGRKRLIALCYLIRAIAVLAMSASTSLWHFWAAAVLSAFAGPGRSLGNALATDLVPRESLGVALSLFNATGWVAGIVGFAGIGHAFQHLGATTTLIATASLPLVALLLLIPIREAERKKQVDVEL